MRHRLLMAMGLTAHRLIVIFGEPGDAPRLGATTLKGLGLTLDPFKRRLLPMRPAGCSRRAEPVPVELDATPGRAE
jgi:hypothetical protein